MIDILDRCRSKTYVMSCYSKSDDLYAAMKQTLRDAGDEIESLRSQLAAMKAQRDRAIVIAEHAIEKWNGWIDDAIGIDAGPEAEAFIAELQAMKP